jgi:hypothetical protein
MLLPPEYAWLELIVLGAVFVFVADLIGNTINFQGRFINAVTTMIVFAVMFALFVRIRFGSVMLTEWGLAVMNPIP